MSITVEDLKILIADLLIENTLLKRQNEQLKQALAAMVKENEIEDQSSNPNSSSTLP